ncbi:hypothetical protein OGAPHI_004129 [Ogataea philodendri]|uniref:Dolichyl-diphosphooligosaccharide--protein glycosyltransferase subunit 3 n=1 Tax=Ogataea philodendri TaxID=1378263 RepID=A0A9P8P651_9ASCO|nr:uncharacterized protein OGAPHI_004129 [Ogataea philodendri]KAH3665940.1 hypothetical protein OGAPHI_004129 [Ogataea philodendri]
MKLTSLLLSIGLLLQTCMGVRFESLISSNKNAVIKINDGNYKSLMNNEDFDLVLFLTASNPQIGCVLCNDFQPIYEQFSSSYYENLKTKGIGKDDTKLVFAMADFPSSRRFFQELSLTNVPKLYYYEATKGSTLQQQDEFQFVVMDSIPALTSWVVSKTKLSPELFTIIQKINYTELILTISAVLGAVSLLALQYKKVLALLAKKRGWQGLSIVVVILFTAGYMFNVIRNTPYVRTNRDGSNAYFIAGHQAQLGAETQIVSVIYGLLAISMVIMIDTLPKLQNGRYKLAGSIGCSVVVFLLYSWLVACFHAKNTGYPFWLLKL